VTNLSLFDAAPIVDVQPAVTPSRIDGVVRLISAKPGAFRELRNGEPTGREFYLAELEPHMEEEFFVWLHSWALFVQRPSDLGYSDEGYDLPPLKVIYHELPTPAPVGKFDRDGQAKMIADAALSLKDAADEKRESIPARVAKMMEIVTAAPDDHFILWHDLEAERHAIEAALPGVKAVFGSLDQDQAEARLVAFANGEEKYLPAKPEMSGSGGNYQRHCHKAVFLGITYKFNDFIAGDPPPPSLPAGARGRSSHHPHRSRASGPRNTEGKWSEDEQLRARMSDIIREHGLNSTGLHERLGRTIGVARRVVKGDRFELVNNDSVDEYSAIDSDRFHLMVTSVPFGNHYEYSASYNDFGHNQDNEAFFRQMDFLTPQLLRTLRPGRSSPST
jgi:hypothetical protein